MSLEYKLVLRDQTKAPEATLALLKHPFALGHTSKEIWIVPGTTRRYLARVFPLDDGFLVEFDYSSNTCERLRPWLDELQAICGVDLFDDDGPIEVDKSAGWFRQDE